MKRGRIVAAAVAVSVLYGAGAGLGVGSPAKQSSFQATLARVQDGPEARKWLDWSDMRAIRKLLGLPPSYERAQSRPGLRGRWNNIVGFGGLGLLSPTSAKVPTATGLDVFSADVVLTAGLIPVRALRLEGPHVDGARIRKALIANGSKPKRGRGGRRYLAKGAYEGEFQVGKLETAFNALNLFDRAVVEKHLLALGAYERAIDEVLGGGRSLAEAPVHRTAGACLGDVLAVHLLGNSEVTTLPRHVSLIATGVRAPASRAGVVEEVICIVTGSSAAAAGRAEALRRVLRKAHPLTGEPWSTSLAGSTVGIVRERGVSAARAVLRLRGSTEVGVLFRLEAEGALDTLYRG